MGLGNLVDDAVGAKEPELPARSRGEAAAFEKGDVCGTPPRIPSGFSSLRLLRSDIGTRSLTPLVPLQAPI